MQRPIRYLFRLTLSCVMVMGLSYFLVQLFLQRSEPGPPSHARIVEATRLRAFSNELVRLSSEFLSAIPPSSGFEAQERKAEFERWLAASLRPRLNDLRQRMVHTDLAGDVFLRLMAGADRAAAMAGRPFDVSVRHLAAGQILDARDACEAYIRRLGVMKYVSPPATRAGFERPR